VFSNAPAPTERYPLSLHDALPIYAGRGAARHRVGLARARTAPWAPDPPARLDLLAVRGAALRDAGARAVRPRRDRVVRRLRPRRSEEHTSELQSLRHLVCRLLLEK